MTPTSIIIGIIIIIIIIIIINMIIIIMIIIITIINIMSIIMSMIMLIIIMIIIIMITKASWSFTTSASSSRGLKQARLSFQSNRCQDLRARRSSSS